MQSLSYPTPVTQPGSETCDILLNCCEGLAAGIEVKFMQFFGNDSTGEEPEA